MVLLWAVAYLLLFHWGVTLRASRFILEQKLADYASFVFLIGPIEILLDMWRRQIVVFMSPNLADCKTATTG